MADDATGDRPLLAVSVVDEHGHGHAGHEAREERDAVLGVDHGIGPNVPHGPIPRRPSNSAAIARM